MNMSIEEKLALVQQMKNISSNNETDRKKGQKKNSVAFFFVRMTFCVALCGILYILIKYNKDFENMMYFMFTEDGVINLIDFFAPFKYTFKG